MPCGSWPLCTAGAIDLNACNIGDASSESRPVPIMMGEVDHGLVNLLGPFRASEQHCYSQISSCLRRNTASSGLR
jgi:hypothetical protein